MKNRAILQCEELESRFCCGQLFQLPTVIPDVLDSVFPPYKPKLAKVVPEAKKKEMKTYIRKPSSFKYLNAVDAKGKKVFRMPGWRESIIDCFGGHPEYATLIGTIYVRGGKNIMYSNVWFWSHFPHYYDSVIPLPHTFSYVLP